MKRTILSSLLAGAICLNVSAQSGTNSPYSQYGLGQLSDQSQGFNRGMSGLGYGLRYGNQVNTLNPASYSAVDSLTMLFDVGMSLQLTNFKDGGTSVNAKNANFEYAVALFRVMPKLGVSVGLLPYTNIGYNYSVSENIGGSSTTSTQQYSGSGGIHQAYLGFGWNIVSNLSLGANFSYLWGSYDRTVQVSSSNSYVNTINRSYNASISSYKIDMGMQWEQPLNKTDRLTVGAAVGLGHKLGADPSVNIVTTNALTSSTTTVGDNISNGLSIPLTIGGGLAYSHARKFVVGVDYSLQKWGSLDFPELSDNSQQYVLKSGLLKDRHKLTVGAEWVPGETGRVLNESNRSIFKRIHYRVGASYATPYYTINGVDGPKELSVSVGLGIPIFNTWNTHNISLLNISGQWVHSSAKDLITENTFRINVGITFNERWFQKWMVK